LDNQAIYFLNELLNQSNETDFLFKDGSLDVSEDDLKENSNDLNEFFEDEENYAEFIEDDDIEDFEDSFIVFDNNDDSDPSDESNDSMISDAKYVKRVKKKIQSKLKQKKAELNKKKK
jgi:hypothetical protein